jgi:hypothetical protein
VYRLTVHGILRVVGDSSAVPKILNIPKRGEHAKAEGSAVRLAESSAVEIDYFPNSPPETVARWLELADRALVERAS